MSTPSGSDPSTDDVWSRPPADPQPVSPEQPTPPPGYQAPAPGSQPPPPTYPTQPPPYPGQPGGPTGYPGYPQPGTPGWVQSPRNGLGTAALVLGILSIPGAFLGGIGGILLGVIGLILGIVGLNRARRGGATNRGAALAGTILSIAGLVLGIALLGSYINRYWDCVDPNRRLSDESAQACVERIDRERN